jgi:hypothetical protein
MPKYSKRSQSRLDTCDERLRQVFEEVIKHWDCTILEGHRSKHLQNQYYNSVPQRSKIQWPNSKHNSTPSMAVDAVPYPIDWNDWNRFYAFSGFVVGIGAAMGITIRSGLDWDKDRDFNDQNFNDAPHFEVVED